MIEIWLKQFYHIKSIAQMDLRQIHFRVSQITTFKIEKFLINYKPIRCQSYQ